MLGPRSSQRFPVRTLVLMILALVAFIWMWVNTHHHARPKLTPLGPVPTQPGTEDHR